MRNTSAIGSYYFVPSAVPSPSVMLYSTFYEIYCCVPASVLLHCPCLLEALASGGGLKHKMLCMFTCYRPSTDGRCLT